MKPLRPNRRIFHMVTSLEVGGSEHQMVEVASRQSARGYLVIVGCLSSKGSFIEVFRRAGICVIEFNPKGCFFVPGHLSVTSVDVVLT